MKRPSKVAILGSGNWGTTVGKLIAENVANLAGFDSIVSMYVYEELINGEKLSSIINTKHENVRYLKGIRLPKNLVAVPDPGKAIEDATHLIFVLPHQFVANLLPKLEGYILRGARALSLVKGFRIAPEGPLLMSELITRKLSVPCDALSGANIAREIALEKFAETTIGTTDVASGRVWQQLLQKPYFRVSVVPGVANVEMCGALKNVVALAAGFCDGLGQGNNTKAAIMRIGMVEMIEFIGLFYKKDRSVFFESCGVADLITTCYGGRNRKVGAAFARTGKPIGELEAELLNGQKAQGVQTAEEAATIIKSKGLEAKFPLFMTTYDILYHGKSPKTIISMYVDRPKL